MEEIKKQTSCLCDFHVTFWSARFKTDIQEVGKITEKVARLGIVREEQGTGNQDPIV